MHGWVHLQGVEGLKIVVRSGVFGSTYSRIFCGYLQHLTSLEGTCIPCAGVRTCLHLMSSSRCHFSSCSWQFVHAGVELEERA